MVSRSLKSAVDRLAEAAAEPELWPEVLPLLADALGAVGAACFGCNDQTAGVEWACFCGPASARKYIDQYAAIDPYAPVLRRSEYAGWRSLAECVPGEVLRRNEWYHDYVQPSGVSEVLGAQIYRAGSRSIYFGMHYSTSQSVVPQDAPVRLLLQRLKAAAVVWHRNRELMVHASLGAWTIDHHPSALFVVYDGGRIIEMNAAAERLLSGSDVLRAENGRLVAGAPTDAAPLGALLMAAADTEAPAPEQRLLIGAAQAGHGHLVTAFPLPNAGPKTGQMVLRVTSLFADPPESTDLQQVFRLTPAESRLAQALLKGKTLGEMVEEFGVSMPTLRVQVRSVFRKCGVNRQVDLVRVLLRAT